MNKLKNQIVLFDGVCNLCTGLVIFIIDRDPNGHFKFASLQSNTGKTLLRDYKLPTNTYDTVVYIKNERAYLKSTAAIKILRDLGWPWSITYITIIIPKFIRNIIYDWIAKTRYNRFGKRDTCLAPNPDIRNRFIE